MSAISLSVAVMAYNEERFLGDTVVEVLDVFRKLGITDHEILIYDDGSADRTPEIADRLAAAHPGVTVIHNRPNRGVGFSIKDSIRRSSKQYYTYIPADHQFDFHSLSDYLPLVPAHDIVLGYMKNKQDRPRLRRLLSDAYVLCINFLFNTNFKYTNGMSLLRLEKIKDIELVSAGHTITAEIMLKAVITKRCTYSTAAGFRYIDVDKVSTAVGIPAIIRSFLNIIRLRKELGPLKR